MESIVLYAKCRTDFMCCYGVLSVMSHAGRVFWVCGDSSVCVDNIPGGRVFIVL